MHTIFTPVRVAAALARGRLLTAAAGLWSRNPAASPIVDGVVMGRRGRRASFGELTHLAAVVPNDAGRGAPQAAIAVQDGRDTARRGSTRRTSSPGASSSRWTSTCPARCRRWCARRRRSTGRPAACATSLRSRRCRASPTSRSSRTPPRARRRRRAWRRRSGSASTRCARWRSSGDRARSTGSPTRTCSPTSRPRSCR